MDRPSFHTVSPRAFNIRALSICARAGYTSVATQLCVVVEVALLASSLPARCLRHVSDVSPSLLMEPMNERRVNQHRGGMTARAPASGRPASSGSFPHVEALPAGLQPDGSIIHTLA